MLVVPSKQMLVINTPLSADILTIIPHARKFVHKGKELTAVAHGMDEARVLKNLGFDVPHPINHYYKWSGRFKPMAHQKETAAFMASHRKALCLNAPGTGKTISVLWAADYLMNIGVVKKVLIIAPLSTLKPVWGNEFMQHFIHRQFNIIMGARAKRERMITDDIVDFSIINHDGFTTMPWMFKDYDLIIYDEVTALKSPSSQRYKKFFKFMQENNPRLWMLTGTPISQNPTDAWTLAKLAGSPSVPRSFTQFKDMTMQRVTQFRWIPRAGALAVCKEVLQPSIRFSLDECMDLPQTLYLERRCELTKQQEKAFEAMKAEAYIAGANISAANAAVMFQKLLQICCGVVYDSDGNRVMFNDTNRIDTLLEIIDEIGDKVIVYVPLRGVQDRIEKVLIDKGMDVATVHGDVSKSDRDVIFDTFQKSDKIQVLIAHPRVAAHGLTLTRAKNIIWYAPIHSLEQYEQANARIRRLSTAGKTAVHHICATSFEHQLYQRLKKKQRVLSDFLSLVRGVNDRF